MSTSRYLMSLGSTAISWKSCKQFVLAHFTTDQEYVAAIEATKEIVSLWKILDDLQEKQVKATPF